MDKSEVIFRVKDGFVFFSFVVDAKSFDQYFLDRIVSVLSNFLNEEVSYA